MNTISFFVEGRPAPKGSGKAIMLPGRSWPVIVNASKGCRTWDRQLTKAAQSEAAKQLWKICKSEINVTLAFFLPRPKDQFVGRKQPALIRDCAPKKHLKKPDLDKLTRLVLDAMTGTLWVDDSQVTTISCCKAYADARTGVLISVDEATL